MGSRTLSACAAALLLTTAGCAPLDRTSGDRALTGTAAGAAVGLLSGGILSSTVTGAVAGGLVYDQIRKSR
jgi:hypothetical protein